MTAIDTDRAGTETCPYVCNHTFSIVHTPGRQMS